jgi:hypothetical protein
LEQAGVRCCAFHEPDLNHQLTALATEPLSGAKRAFLGKLQLLTVNG